MRCQTHPLKPPQLVTPFLSRSTKDKLPSSLSHLPHAPAFDHDPQLSFTRVPCVRVCFMPFNIENYWRCFRTLESEWDATLMVLCLCCLHCSNMSALLLYLPNFDGGGGGKPTLCFTKRSLFLWHSQMANNVVESHSPDASIAQADWIP